MFGSTTEAADAGKHALGSSACKPCWVSMCVYQGLMFQCDAPHSVHLPHPILALDTSPSPLSPPFPAPSPSSCPPLSSPLLSSLLSSPSFLPSKW